MLPIRRSFPATRATPVDVMVGPAMQPLFYVEHRGGPDDPTLPLFGLHALIAEMASQGVSAARVLAGTGVRQRQLDEPHSLMSRRQRLAIYRNAQRLAKRSDVGLRAGARQRVGDFAVYGYALTSSPTLGAALDLTFKHLRMAGPVFQMSSRIEGDVGILRSHDPWSAGELLPFVAEFWRSSINALLSGVLESPFPTLRMLLPYAAPPHWREYERMFRCPIDFDAEVMEWHYDATQRDRPLPNANPLTESVCQSFCEQIIAGEPEGSGLLPSIRTLLVNQPGRFENVGGIADRLGMSVRTLHRRLAAEGVTYQSIIDDLRHRLAVQYLAHTTMTIEQISQRTGFSDPANFRKAYKRWTGRTPRDERPGRPVSE